MSLSTLLGYDQGVLSNSPTSLVHLRLLLEMLPVSSRCPLYFPLPVESVVFLRTGCLSHVKKYLSFADSTSFPPNITGDPGPTEAEKEKVSSY